MIEMVYEKLEHLYNRLVIPLALNDLIETIIRSISHRATYKPTLNEIRLVI